jgi:uncharacterized protein (DUF58 family)
MLSPNLLRRIRRIELRSRRLVHNAFAGAYHSIYKGRGMSFANVRLYSHGDDVRSIDWKVSARAGQTYIKEFVEERELTLMIIIDGSASVLFGTQDKEKRDFAAELGAVLAYAANANNDKAGLMVFSDAIEHYVAPKKGKNHLLRIIRDLLTVETSGKGTDLGLALRTANRFLRQGSIVFILSDFLMDAENYQKDLLLLSKKHETIAIVLSDPLEEALPDVGMMGLRDAETGQVSFVDTSSKKWQKQFREERERIVLERNKAFQKAGAESIEMPPDSDYIRALSQFFQRQARKQR